MVQLMPFVLPILRSAAAKCLVVARQFHFFGDFARDIVSISPVFWCSAP
jgi:hypothetical protein